MTIKLQIGLDAINSYKRLAYTPWHAIAEFVDNSTQSYFNNRELLDQSCGTHEECLTVSIDYESRNDLFRVTDNAMGMSYEELQYALHIGQPPANTSGRSKYGMGLKTAACWIGNLWSVRTKKFGETTEHTVTVDVERVASGQNDLPYSGRPNCPETDHYTVIEIRKHNREFKGRTLNRIEQYLSSMYREDFRKKILVLIWRDIRLTWTELDDRLLTAVNGSVYKRNFGFHVDGDPAHPDKKHYVYGWVGVLRDGSRSDAGFSIIHSGRVVRGWPDAWRPHSLFGQEQGSNDLVNQRLVGEAHLDDFDVSHTKDDILWLGDQEDQVESKLLEECGDYRETARTYRRSQDDRRGPTEVETSAAISELTQELNSPEMADIVAADPMLSKPLVEQVVKSVKEYVVKTTQETFLAVIAGLAIRGYVKELSPNEPYVTIDATQKTEVLVIVNASHPHWNQLRGSQGVLNYLRHCTYDGIAEWQARSKTAQIDPDTIKILKDRLLRIPLEIERHTERKE